MRVHSRGRIYAILNVEDDQTNAFSREEEETLRTLLDDLGEVIDERRKDSLVRASFEVTPTAVFLVDQEGIIREVNPAACNTLGRTADELIGASITQFIVKQEIRSAVADAPRPTGEIDLLGPGEKSIRGVLVGAPLKGTFGLRMLTFRDTSVQRRVQELDALTRVYSEMARQVKPDLAIIGACLRDLRELTEISASQYLKGALGLDTRLTKDLPSALDNILLSLRQIESSFDKLLYLGAGTQLPEPELVAIYIPRFVEDLKSELPTMSGSVQIANSSEHYLSGDPSQLALVIHSVVSYLLPFARRSTPVALEIKDAGTCVDFMVSGPYSIRQDEYRGPDDLALARSIQDLALGIPYLTRIVQNHKGTFQGPVFKDGHLFIAFRIPTMGVTR
jgi:hypothetical protein